VAYIGAPVTLRAKARAKVVVLAGAPIESTRILLKFPFAEISERRGQFLAGGARSLPDDHTTLEGGGGKMHALKSRP